LAAQTSAENHLKVSLWQHLWQQLTDFARYRLDELGAQYGVPHAQPPRASHQQGTTPTVPPRSSKTRSASNPTTSPTTASRRTGRPIASSAPESSANGCRPRRVS
jgi:hypothetical protein